MINSIYYYIIDNIYIGNIYSLSSAFDELNLNIIISLVPSCLPKFRNPNMSKKYLLEVQHYNIHIENEIYPFFKDIYNIIKKSKGKKIFIHCTDGLSLSPAVMIYYLMHEYNKTFFDSFQFVKNKNKSINIKDEIISQLSSHNYL
jgi:protein-tyrosine phosphatase